MLGEKKTVPVDVYYRTREIVLLLLLLRANSTKFNFSLPHRNQHSILQEEINIKIPPKNIETFLKTRNAHTRRPSQVWSIFRFSDPIFLQFLCNNLPVMKNLRDYTLQQACPTCVLTPALSLLLPCTRSPPIHSISLMPSHAFQRFFPHSHFSKSPY